MANSSEEVSLITDGSAEVNSESAGAAFILQSSDRSIRIKGNAFLGPACSVEAEMIAGVLGIMMARRVSALGFISEDFQLTWRLDHQSTIDGLNHQISSWREQGWGVSKRTAPKHLALWQLLDGAIEEIPLCVTHVSEGGDVAAHTACDRASRWARRSADRLLSADGGSPVGRVGEYQPENAWRFLDARELMNLAREFPANNEALRHARSITEQIVVEKRSITG